MAVQLGTNTRNARLDQVEVVLSTLADTNVTIAATTLGWFDSA